MLAVEVFGGFHANYMGSAQQAHRAVMRHAVCANDDYAIYVLARRKLGARTAIETAYADVLRRSLDGILDATLDEYRCTERQPYMVSSV
jgi:hypothetical protein